MRLQINKEELAAGWAVDADRKGYKTGWPPLEKTIEPDRMSVLGFCGTRKWWV